MTVKGTEGWALSDRWDFYLDQQKSTVPQCPQVDRGDGALVSGIERVSYRKCELMGFYNLQNSVIVCKQSTCNPFIVITCLM